MKTIPQFIRAEVREDDGMSWGLPPKLVDVFIGDTVVYTHTVDFYFDDTEAEWEAVTEFGKMLKLKIGD